VGGEYFEPWFAQIGFYDLEERPGQVVGSPWVGVAVDSGGAGQRVADQAPREGEAKVRAHTVGSPGRRAEPSGQTVR
jgi:hypothetical protein